MPPAKSCALLAQKKLTVVRADTAAMRLSDNGRMRGWRVLGGLAAPAEALRVAHAPAIAPLASMIIERQKL
jgi:hypothetical protein